MVICVAMLAGCSDEVMAPVETPTPTPAVTGGEIVPQTGGVLKLPMPAGAKLGNPLLGTSREMSSVYGLVFESLLQFDDNGAPGPCLAETWKKSDDGLKWTFTLRSGVKWQGTDRALTAGDIKFTLDEIKSLGTGADKPWGYILNYLKSWQEEADGTLTIELKTPFYGALHALTFPILPAEVGYENGQAPSTPIGTGPYKVTAYTEGKTISLAANTDWWQKSPWIPNIEVAAYPDNATEVSSMLLSQLDAVQTDNLTVSQYRDSGEANLYEYPTRFFEFMAFNFSSPDIQDKQIRQAIAYAIDRREIVSFTYVNHAIVSDTPVPPDSWLYDGKLLKYDNNVDEARRLIKLAGWQDSNNDKYWDLSPDGVSRELKFTLLMNRDENNTLRNDAALLIAGQLDKAGIKVELKTASWTDYQQMLKEKQFDLALCGCYVSPVPDYKFLLGSGGALNVGGYKSDAMDSLLDSIVQSADGATLKVKIGELQTAVIEDLPILCLYFRTHSLLTSPVLQSMSGAVSGAKEDAAYSKISQWFK